ncbi:MAG: DsbA family protein [Pseudomonadota bacterium]
MVATACALTLAACASDQLDLAGGGVSTAAISNPNSPFGQLGGNGTSADDETTGFNPFEERPDTLRPRLVVIENPTVQQVMKASPLPEMSWGRPDAPITVIKYASLTCPICRKFQRQVYPKFKSNYIDTGKVRYIIREFPIGRSSGNATIALRCAKPQKYMALYTAFLNQQNRWVSQDVRLHAIHAVAKPFGLSRAQFDACLENQKMISGLKWIKDRGRTLGVIGTPNFFIQGKLYKKALGYEDLKREVDAALALTLASAG